MYMDIRHWNASYGEMPGQQESKNLTVTQIKKCNLPTPPFLAPVGMSQPDHHGDGWSVDQPNTQGKRA